MVVRRYAELAFTYYLCYYKNSMVHGTQERLAAGALAFGVLTTPLSACTVFEDGPTLEACYDIPQPLPKFPEYPDYDPAALPEMPDSSQYDYTPEGTAAWDSAFAAYKEQSDAFYAEHEARVNEWRETLDPPNIEVPVTHGIAEGDPINPSRALSAAATAAVVRISVEGGKGSGFVVLNEEQEPVVITAAHVVIGESLNDITITTNEGETASPTGGCVIYEKDGRPVDTSEEEKNGYYPDYDIAVLTYEDDLNITPLPVAKEMPAVGDWVYFVNYQGAYGPKESLDSSELFAGPAEYTGIMTPKYPTTTHRSVITGARDMGPNYTRSYFDSIHMRPGASGGPVLDEAGEVIGISVATTPEGIYLGPDDLNKIYNIDFRDTDEKPDKSFRPTNAIVLGTNILNLVLDAPAALGNTTANGTQ